MTRSGRSRLAIAAPLLVAVLGLAACSHDGHPAATSSAQSQPTTTTTPSIDPSVVPATVAYQGYVAAYAHAANTADFNDPALPLYIGGGLLSLSQHNLRGLADHGAVELGTPTAIVQTTSAALSAQPPTVTITACLDYTSYQLVYTSTRSPVPGGELTNKRYTTTATVQLFSDGKWRVSADAPHRDTPC